MLVKGKIIISCDRFCGQSLDSFFFMLLPLFQGAILNSTKQERAACSNLSETRLFFCAVFQS